MDRPAEFLDALAHHLQSHAVPLGDLAGVKAHSVIADGDGDPVRRVGDGHVDGLWLAVPDGIAAVMATIFSSRSACAANASAKTLV